MSSKRSNSSTSEGSPPTSKDSGDISQGVSEQEGDVEVAIEIQSPSFKSTEKIQDQDIVVDVQVEEVFTTPDIQPDESAQLGSKQLPDDDNTDFDPKSTNTRSAQPTQITSPEYFIKKYANCCRDALNVRKPSTFPSLSSCQSHTPRSCPGPCAVSRPASMNCQSIYNPCGKPSLMTCAKDLIRYQIASLSYSLSTPKCGVGKCDWSSYTCSSNTCPTNRPCSSFQMPGLSCMATCRNNRSLPNTSLPIKNCLKRNRCGSNIHNSVSLDSLLSSPSICSTKSCDLSHLAVKNPCLFATLNVPISSISGLSTSSRPPVLSHVFYKWRCDLGLPNNTGK